MPLRALQPASRRRLAAASAGALLVSGLGTVSWSLSRDPALPPPAAPPSVQQLAGSTGARAEPPIAAGLDRRRIAAEEAEVLARSAPVAVRIPAAGVRSSLIHLGLLPDGSLEVPASADAVGWYTGSPTPGELGPAVLAGHVDSRQGPGVFFHLRDLAPGDEIEIDRTDGSTASFVVERVEQYPKDAFPTRRVYGDVDHAALRLITCGGTFDRATRHYRSNVVVFARLATAA